MQTREPIRDYADNLLQTGNAHGALLDPSLVMGYIEGYDSHFLIPANTTAESERKVAELVRSLRTLDYVVNITVLDPNSES